MLFGADKKKLHGKKKVFSSNLKTKKINREVNLGHDVCALLSVAQFTKVTFVWSTKEQRGPGTREQVLDLDRPARHPDGRPMSICSQFLIWGFGPNAVLDTHLIDIWQHGTELYLFLADNTNGPNDTVRIKFKPYSDWAAEQRYQRIDERLITDEEYAQTIRKRVQSEFPHLNPPRYPTFLMETEASHRDDPRFLAQHDPVELYKNALRNLVRKDMQQKREAAARNVTFPSYRDWVAEQRTLGLGQDATTEEDYAQSLMMQVWDLFQLNAKSYDTFLLENVESFARADSNPIESYKDYLLNFIRMNVNPKKRKNTSALLPEPKKLAQQADVQNMTPEDWALFIGSLAPGLRDLPLALAEPTMADAGVLSSFDSEVEIYPKAMIGGMYQTIHIKIKGSDTMSTLLQKVHEATGIPLDSMKLVGLGRELTNLEMLRGLQKSELPFVALPSRPR